MSNKKRRESRLYRPGDGLLVTERTEGTPGWYGVGVISRADRKAMENVEAHVDIEDIERSWEEAFGDRPVLDMKYQCQKVVVAINHNKSLRIQEQTRRSYLMAFADINLCYRCRNPIKLKKASIGYLNVKKGIVEAPPKEAVAHRSISYRRYGEKWVSKFEWRHFDWKAVPNAEYADIQSHFEWNWREDDEDKAFYQYIDGTGRDIRMERVLNKDRKYNRFDEYFVEVLEDGTKVRCVPEPSYRLFNIKCECDFRKLQRYV